MRQRIDTASETPDGGIAAGHPSSIDFADLKFRSMRRASRAHFLRAARKPPRRAVIRPVPRPRGDPAMATRPARNLHRLQTSTALEPA
ncbi:hypothetical protein [Paraburkholderia caballeronis]|uniref:hypothetical protein n=1 Tax=Paraburkholderia caballeronis TaxID=416943 RepID=UPI00115FF046|nr:hypothetical protein [Paraburkholderia caballeronis]